MKRSPAKRTGELFSSIAKRYEGRSFSDFLSRHSNGLGWVVAAALFAVPLFLVLQAYGDIGDQNDRIERQNHRIERQNHRLAVQNDKIEDQQAHLRKERSERVKVQNAINAYICTTNNEQDGVLASLIAVSLGSSPPDSQLTEEQQAGKAIFERALYELEDRVNCDEFKLPPPGVIPNPKQIPKLQESGVGSGGER
jgi:hypothetical protein